MSRAKGSKSPGSLPATMAHTLETMAGGGSLGAVRIYPGPWRYLLKYPETPGEPPKAAKNLSEGAVQDLASRLYVTGDFKDLGQNTHTLAFMLTEYGRAVLELYLNDPRVAARKGKAARGAA